MLDEVRKRVSLVKETLFHSACFLDQGNTLLDLACFLGQGNTLHEISLDITTRKFT